MGRALGVVADGAGAALGTAAHAHSGQTDAAVRSDLVAAHKLLAMHGFDELTWNHISSRVGPQHDDASVFLITPGTKMYMDINRADLCLVDESRRSQSDQVTNETGDIIHSAVYSARKDVCAIVHTHIPAVVAVACLKEGLMCVDQSSAPFYKNVAYYDWQGVSTDTNERMDIAKACAGGEMTLMMRNHGACTFGATVGEAWVRMYYLERACRLHLELMKCGGEINTPSDDTMAHAAKQSMTEFTPGFYEWAALKQSVENQFGPI